MRMIHKNRGNRRFIAKEKAKRKIRLIHEFYNDDDTSWIIFGKYRKGKIHCSCPMCAAKTNSRLNKSGGPVYNVPINPTTGHPATGRHGSRLAVTNGRYGKKNYTPSERKKVDGMYNQLTEYGYA